MQTAAPLLTTPRKIYRRRVRLRADGLAMVADMEDFQHRFGVDISHDGRMVTTISGRAMRTPWSICEGATTVLGQLAGSPLLHSPYAVLRQVKLMDHCTHLIDLAGFAIAAAARQVGHRQYDLTIAHGPGDEPDRRHCEVWRDGTALPSWTIHKGIITTPAAYAGLELRRAASWIRQTTGDADEQEVILLVQRGYLVAFGLDDPDLDTLNNATDSRVPVNACYSLQTARVAKAARNQGSAWDIPNQEALLVDLEG